MTQKNVVFKYGNANVTFLTEGENVKVNATEMAKLFGNSKKPNDWLKTKQSKEYIKALVATKILDPADLLIVINGGNNYGT